MKTRRESSSWTVPDGRWTSADGLAMHEALSASGLTQRAFAVQHGIAAHRVSYWVSKQRSSAFGEAVVVPEPDRADGAARVELELGNGRRLALLGAWDAIGIQRWVRALEAL